MFKTSEIIGLVLMIPCAVWLIAQIIIGFKEAKEIIADQNLDIRVKCEECGLEYTVPIKELVTTSSLNKDVRTVSLQTPVAGATIPTSMKRKCRCPNCNKTVYASISDAQQLSIRNTTLSVPVLLKHLAIGAAPFAILVIVSEMIGL